MGRCWVCGSNGWRCRGQSIWSCPPNSTGRCSRRALRRVSSDDYTVEVILLATVHIASAEFGHLKNWAFSCNEPLLLLLVIPAIGNICIGGSMHEVHLRIVKLAWLRSSCRAQSGCLTASDDSIHWPARWRSAVTPKSVRMRLAPDFCSCNSTMMIDRRATCTSIASVGPAFDAMPAAESVGVGRFKLESCAMLSLRQRETVC